MKQYLFLLIFLLFLGSPSMVFSQKTKIENNQTASTVASDNQFELSKNIDIYMAVLKSLNELYVDEINPAALVKTSIDAMLKTLDPYTNFFPESEAEDVKFMTTGTYGGVGSMIGKSGDYVVITEPYEGFPAQKAGLRAGDLIMEIDGKSAKGMSTEDVTTLLKGQPGTIVKVVVSRPGDDKNTTFELTRANIKIGNIPYYGMVTENIGYISLSGFKENASDNIRAAFEELKKNNNLKGLILDLRGNPGGLLIEAVRVSNLFIEKNQLVVSTKGKVDSWNKEYKTAESPVDDKIPLVILTNAGSASASEIVSGCLQDLDRAVILGQRTLGKGLVQTTKPLSYNTQMKLTTSKYYIPSGRCIQEIDYSHRDKTGTALKVPDSLVHQFTTKNGRPVTDGKGILPDVKTDLKENPEVVKTLINDRFIFDFATQYRLKHDSIVKPSKFELTDADYTEFVNFVKSKNIKYKTPTDKALDALRKKAEDDKYLDLIKTDLENIAKKLEEEKNDELLTYKTDIMRLLRQEIVSRYFYQKGRIEASLSTDTDILEAVKILSDLSAYKKILDPKI